jgi:NADH-quinone oxidoreductase subunit L
MGLEMKFIITAIPVLPLVASVITLILGRRFLREASFVPPILSILISFFLSLIVLSEVIHGKTFEFDLFTWISASSLKVGLGFLIDSLSIMMVCMVLSLSLLIHIYSIGYMSGDPGFYRFFAYISLFTFSMLALVMSNNLLQLYLGWEAVGLCSYLLIGFWYEKKSASDAAKKAFIVNRIGDFGFALGIFLLFSTVGGLYYHQVFDNLPLVQGKTISFLGIKWSLPFLISFLLFMGAMGKSAQVPLHVWLPDAMEGPTPVSALIHAATMVTAGVFMVARLHPLYLLSPGALELVALVGSFTCFMAATIAPTQFDIKRVIAYSTLSQLGYMFMACGVGAFAAGMFHLFTHAYFKALLFLAAGSVIHALHHAPDPNDIRIMGGLRKYMPYTFLTFLIGALALSGFPGFAGFFSKEGILISAYLSPYPWGKLVWLVGLFVAFLTSFYTFRLVFVVFFGDFRGDSVLHGEEPHESPWVMVIPLIIISIGAIFSGYLDVPGFLEKTLTQEPLHPHHGGHFLQNFLALMAGILGIFTAWWIYLKNPELKEIFPKKFPGLYKFLYNKWWFDEVYHKIFVEPVLFLSKRGVVKFSDSFVIEGIVNGSARLVSGMASAFRRVHTGIVNHYAALTLLGVIIYLLVFFYLR